MLDGDPVLARFRAALAVAYGERLDRVVLFGSRARGDATPDSDYDIAVFLHRMDGMGTESSILAAIETQIMRDTGAVINTLPFSADHAPLPTILMHNIRREGIPL